MSVNTPEMIAAVEPVRTAPAVFAGYRPVLDKIKPSQWVTWKLGETSEVGTTFRVATERVCRALELQTGERVLNVTAGNSNASLPTGENIPFRDSAFDVVLSGFAAMYAADHHRMARELLRVCRRGGRIGLACWTPRGFNGQLVSTVARYVSGQSEPASPVLWGTKEYLNALFGASADALGATIRTHTWSYPSPEQWLNAWTSRGGPLHDVYRSIDPEWREQFSSELLALVGPFNKANDGSMVVLSEYLEFLVHKTSWQS
jgi:SAM-dependent methyltransferase